MATDPIIVSEGSKAYSGYSLNIPMSVVAQPTQTVVAPTPSVVQQKVSTIQQRPIPAAQSQAVRDALDKISRQRDFIRDQIRQKEINDALESQFLSQELGYESYKGIPLPYRGSVEQLRLYEELESQDPKFKKFIIETYGSFENYVKKQTARFKSSIFDPAVDYTVDVTVIKIGNQYYKSDHISTDEVIMESLTGVCTFFYTKVDNSEGRSTGTLNASYIPDDQMQWRGYFFSPLKNNRVVIWDISKRRWNSFYMHRLNRFVKDDTVSIE